MCPQDCWAGLLSGISCFWQATIGRWAIQLPWISGFVIMSGRKISIEYKDLQSWIILSAWEWLHGVCRPEWAVSCQPGVNRDCPPLRGVPLWCRHFDASQMLIFNGVGLQIQHNWILHNLMLLSFAGRLVNCLLTQGVAPGWLLVALFGAY